MSDVPEGYKVSEVGVIPDEWGVKTLGAKTTKIGSGITPTGGEKVYKSEGRPFLRSQNVGWGNLILEDIAFIDDKIHNTFKATEIEKNDVFLNITGASIGRSTIADERVESGNVNQHVCIIRTIKDELNPKFLNYFLLSKKGQKQIDSFQAGGNRQGLNFGQIKSFQIPLPPLPEQQAIASALSDVDALIAALEQLITKKRNIKQGAMQQLLTGEKRLPGFGGAWEVKRLGDFASLNRVNIIPASVPDQLFVHFSLPAFDAGKIPVVELGGAIGSNKFRVVQEAILVSKLNPRIPRVWAPTKIPTEAIASTEFLVLTPKEVVSRQYLFVVCSSPSFCVQMELAATGTTGSHQRISPTEALNINVSLPVEVEEQQAIAQILSDMDTEIEALKQKRDKYKAIKQGMMQELLTGKTRLVKEDKA